jgi:hypothetical protein
VNGRVAAQFEAGFHESISELTQFVVKLNWTGSLYECTGLSFIFEDVHITLLIILQIVLLFK